MKYLTENAWSAFQKRGTTPPKFDGDAFESLIRQLLKECFPGEWQATPKTRDGGKDVVDRSIPGAVSWAECKMYRAPLSLQVVSNTLVMAVVEENVKRILFFSFSEMIGNAKYYLAKFSTKTGKSIQVFDGELLEELILRSPGTMAAHFPEFTVRLPVAELPQPIFKAHFSTDVHISQQQLVLAAEEDKPRHAIVPLNTPCLYEIVFIARHAEGRLILKVELNEKEFEHFDILSADHFARLAEFSLESGQIVSIPIYLAPLISGPLRIPAITFRSDRGHEFELPKLEFSVSSLVRPTLIGKAVQAALDAFESIISNGNSGHVLTVAGRSGVGKSRFIDEATMRLLKNGYEIHHFDGLSRNNQSTEAFIKSLLCSIWRLPDTHAFHDNNRRSSEHEPLAPDAYGLVTDIAYNWNVAKLEKEKVLVNSVLIEGLRTQRGALIIDNVQAFSAPILDVLIVLVESVVAMPGQVAVLLAFNEDDVVFNDAAGRWLKELKRYQGSGYAVLELPDFSRPLAEEFLDNLFGIAVDDVYFCERYPILVNTILEKIVARPLDLFQFIKGLEDRGALRIGADVFTIVDFDQFGQALETLDGKRERLLDWRMERLDSIVDATFIVSALTYFGPLQPRQLDQLGIPETSYEKLVQASILSWDNNGHLMFYHPSLTRYFINDTKQGKFLKKAVKTTLYARANSELFCRTPEWFGLAFDIGADVTAVLDLTVAQFLGQVSTGYAQHYLVADRFLKHAAALKHLDKLWPIMPALTGAAHVASQSTKKILNARSEHLLAVASKIAPQCPPDLNLLSHWTHVIRETAGYLASKNSDTADQLLTQALSSLDSTDFPPLIVKRSQANFQNRRCVTLKTLGRRAEATAAGQASLKLASEYKMPGLICLNLIDLGYVEYGLRDRNQNLLALWEKARDAVPDDSDNIDLSVDISDIRIIGKLISSAVLTLRNDNANAMSQLDQLILDCRERSDYFYQIRAMALKGVALLRHALTETDQSIAMEVCAQALALGYALEDITGSMGEAQRYRSAIYITGKAYETLGEIDKAKRKYKSAADISVSKSFDYEADALSYDIQRLAGRTKTRPSATTYSIGDILLPLP